MRASIRLMPLQPLKELGTPLVFFFQFACLPICFLGRFRQGQLKGATDNLRIRSLNRGPEPAMMGAMSEDGSKNTPLSVLNLTTRIKSLLERSFNRLWVVGEISNFKRASSGHWYFTLKDDKSQIRCNMWRSFTSNVPFRPGDGMAVLVQGALNVYPPRGEYSLMVEHMEEMGLGRLKIEFERLKARLGGEGLFEARHKKALPFLPRKIGVVTSPTGAAFQDILRVLRHRFPGVHVLLFPARVQGSGAAEEIAEGIRFLDTFTGCDVLITGRGGGSEEDLWSFNEEVVARAIFAARTPVISAVGHEVDFTISDFVADIRAATPSNAAELVIKSRTEYRQIIGLLRKNMDRHFQRKILQLKNRVYVSESHPIFLRVRSRVNDLQRRLADLDYRMRNRLEEHIKRRQLRLLRATEGVRTEALRTRIDMIANRLALAVRDLERKSADHLASAGERAGLLFSRLEDLSPLKILSRGYGVVTNRKGKLVCAPEDVRFGEVIRIQLARGEIDARVIEKIEAEQGKLF